jgi:mannose-6-phosphate isomerase-like protein (cupin superfamily)
MPRDPNALSDMMDRYKNDIEMQSSSKKDHPWSRNTDDQRYKYLETSNKPLKHKPTVVVEGPFPFKQFVTANKKVYQRLIVLSRPLGAMQDYLKGINSYIRTERSKIFVAYDTSDSKNSRNIIGWSLILPFSLRSAQNCGCYPDSFLKELLRKHSVPFPETPSKIENEDVFGFLHVHIDFRYRGFGVGKNLAKHAVDYCKQQAWAPLADPVDKIGVRMYEQAGTGPVAPPEEGEHPKVANVLRRVARMLESNVTQSTRLAVEYALKSWYGSVQDRRILEHALEIHAELCETEESGDPTDNTVALTNQRLVKKKLPPHLREDYRKLCAIVRRKLRESDLHEEVPKLLAKVAIIKQVGSKWVLYSKKKHRDKSGNWKRKRLGTHTSRAATERQERAIQMRKHASTCPFRKVLHTTKKYQLAEMCLQPGEDIGVETHPNVQQVFKIISGSGVFTLDGKEQEVNSGDVVVATKGSTHNIENVGKKELKLITLYTPPNHRPGTVHQTKEDAIIKDKTDSFNSNELS